MFSVPRSFAAVYVVTAVGVPQCQEGVASLSVQLARKMSRPAAPKGKKVESCVFNGEKFAIDDTITLRPPNSSGPPFVGK